MKHLLLAAAMTLPALAFPLSPAAPAVADFFAPPALNDVFEVAIDGNGDNLRFRVTSLPQGDASGTLTVTKDPVTIPHAGTVDNYSALTHAHIPPHLWFTYRIDNVTHSLAFTVTAIADYTFQNCTALTSASFPSSLTYFGYAAFNSSGILRADLSACTSLTRIETEAFQSSKIQEVIFPTSITELGASIFRYCYAFTTVNLGQLKKLKSVESRAFNASKLTLSGEQLNWRDGPYALPALTYLGKQAFSGCHNVVGTLILPEHPDTLKMDVEVFRNNMGITKAVLPRHWKRIPEAIFVDCPNLEDVNLDQLNEITTIEPEAFEGCYKLGNLPGKEILRIPPSVDIIYYDAFRQTAFKEVWFLGTPSVGPAVFADCPNLDTIRLFTPQGITTNNYVVGNGVGGEVPTFPLPNNNNPQKTVFAGTNLLGQSLPWAPGCIIIPAYRTLTPGAAADTSIVFRYGIDPKIEIPFQLWDSYSSNTAMVSVTPELTSTPPLADAFSFSFANPLTLTPLPAGTTQALHSSLNFTLKQPSGLAATPLNASINVFLPEITAFSPNPATLSKNNPLSLTADIRCDGTPITPLAPAALRWTLPPCLETIGEPPAWNALNLQLKSNAFPASDFTLPLSLSLPDTLGAASASASIQVKKPAEIKLEILSVEPTTINMNQSEPCVVKLQITADGLPVLLKDRLISPDGSLKSIEETFSITPTGTIHFKKTEVKDEEDGTIAILLYPARVTGVGTLQATLSAWEPELSAQTPELRITNGNLLRSTPPPEEPANAVDNSFGYQHGDGPWLRYQPIPEKPGQVRVVEWDPTLGNYEGPYYTNLPPKLEIPNTVYRVVGDITQTFTVTQVFWAFMKCSDLQEVILPNTLTKLDNGAFSDCSNLSRVNFHELINLDTINYYAFEGTKLGDVKIDLPNLKLIGSWSFRKAQFTSLSLRAAPDAVIGDYTFDGVTSLDSICLKSKFRICGNAFRGCPNIQSLIFFETPEIYKYASLTTEDPKLINLFTSFPSALRVYLPHNDLYPNRLSKLDSWGHPLLPTWEIKLLAPASKAFTFNHTLDHALADTLHYQLFRYGYPLSDADFDDEATPANTFAALPPLHHPPAATLTHALHSATEIPSLGFGKDSKGVHRLVARHTPVQEDDTFLLSLNPLTSLAGDQGVFPDTFIFRVNKQIPQPFSIDTAGKNQPDLRFDGRDTLTLCAGEKPVAINTLPNSTWEVVRNDPNRQTYHLTPPDTPDPPGLYPATRPSPVTSKDKIPHVE
jgi:hypothetical protein